MKPLLCIDYGEKHVGLAIATTPLAEPLKTVPLSKAIKIIQSYIKKHQIKALVIGSSEGQMLQRTKHFTSKLKQIINLPIYFSDETLSSYETRLKIAQAGAKKHKRQGKIDHLVAASILQDYIDSHQDH